MNPQLSSCCQVFAITRDSFILLPFLQNQRKSQQTQLLTEHGSFFQVTDSQTKHRGEPPALQRQAWESKRCHGFISASGTNSRAGFRCTRAHSSPPAQLCGIGWMHRALGEPLELKTRFMDAATKGEVFCSMEAIFAVGDIPW